MALNLKKVADNAYEGSATPPHTQTIWRTDKPVSLRELIKDLQKVGCHQQDIGDALYDIDPDWVSKLE